MQGAQKPAQQSMLQQSVLAMQGCPIARHGAHAPLMHVPSQQSLGALHCALPPLHPWKLGGPHT
jgi:hypothetical protein